jgi:P22_AR N-terminal domain
MTEALEPRAVAFYGDEIIAVQEHDSAIYVLFSRMCENIGRSRVTETRRVQQHAVLNKGLTELIIQTPGGPQNMVCLRLDLIPLWLASIPSSRIKAAFKEKLVRYQTEAAAVLWQAFKPQIVDEQLPANRESALAITQLEQVIEQSRAMQRMAEEQITLIRRMDTAARIVKTIQTDVAAVHVRLGMLEERLHPSNYITDQQAAEVQSAVAAVAMALTKRDPSKNHFQSIHAELHRRYKAKSYSLIRVEQYAAVLKFLEAWDEAMESGTGDA